MYARSTTVLAHLESIDAGVAHIRDEVMPTLLAMDGCIGLSMLADRNAGRCIATSAWRSREDMLASERQLRPVRDHAAEILGNKPQVDEWEIAVLHRDHTSGPGACVRASWVRMAPELADRVVDVYRMALLPVGDLVAGGQEAVEGHADVERGPGRCGARGVRCLKPGSRPLRDDNAVADQAAPVAALEHQPHVRAGGASGAALPVRAETSPTSQLARNRPVSATSSSTAG